MCLGSFKETQIYWLSLKSKAGDLKFEVWLNKR